MARTDDRRSTIAAVTGTVIAVTGLGFVLWRMVGERETLAPLLADATLAWFALALAAGLAAMSGIGLTWGVILRRLGAPLSPLATLRGYFVGQLGKYVPGGIWGLVGRGEWARREGVPALTAYSSALLSMVTAYLAACVVALAGAGLGGVAREARMAALAVGALAPLGFALLQPRVMAAATRRIELLGRRRIDLEIPAWSTSFEVVVRQVPSWLLIVAATWAVARGLGADVEPIPLVLATSVSWVVGFLALPVPGGIGVREAAFVAMLGGGGVAAAIALCARLVFVLVDLFGASGAMLLLAARQGRGSRMGTRR